MTDNVVLIVYIICAFVFSGFCMYIALKDNKK